MRYDGNGESDTIYKQSDEAQTSAAPALYDGARSADERLLSQAEELMRKIREESVYEEIPGRIEGSKTFIGLAEKLANDFGICYEILEGKGYVTVALYHLGINFGEFPARLGELISLADTFDTLAVPNDEGYVKITLTYRTHDHYVGGKLQIL